MKSKESTYVLGVVVLLVWGLIFYKIFNSWRDKGNGNITNNIFNKKDYNDYTIKDTSYLILNYRDPFRLSNHYIDPSENKTPSNTMIPQQPKAVPHLNITYSGYVNNPSTKKLMAMLTVQGKNVLLAEGESSGNIKLLRNLKDSVKVTYYGNIKYLSLTSPEN